jgi:hypothetical protein
VEKVFVLQRVATKLFATENAVDSALTETAGLVADMIQARKDLGLSAMVGEAAQAKLVEAIAALGAARSAVIAAHGQLEETKLRLGVRTKLAGYEDKGNASADHPQTSMRIAS